MNKSFFRRYLPHWQPAGGMFFITYRLAGTLPERVLNELKEEKQRLLNLKLEQEYVDKSMFAFFDDYLDKSKDIEWLLDSQIAKVVRDNLYYHAGEKYYLWAYVIMPNHVHLVLQPTEDWIKRFDMENVPQAASSENEKYRQAACGTSRYERGILSGILHSLRSYTANEAKDSETIRELLES